MSELLKCVMLLFFLFMTDAGQIYGQINGKTAVLNYINHLAKEGGGYGWEDQPDAHLTPTFAAIGILHNLSELPDDKRTLIKIVRTHHPQRNPQNREAGFSGVELRDLVYQQIQGLLWLGADVTEFEADVAGWELQLGKTSNFERSGYPSFMLEMMTPVVRGLMGMSQDESILDYITERRRKNGSFNSAPARDGGDGNILNTWWGVYGLFFIEDSAEFTDATINWLRTSQISTGGFTHQPDPQIGINDEVAYTWAAIRALDLLNGEPANRNRAISYLLSLQNSDGGFGNRPGLPSTPMASFYAVDGLRHLDALSELESQQIHEFPNPVEASDFSQYNIYTVQFQAPGSGSPYEAVMLADSLNIDLWGAKNTDANWIESARVIAEKHDVKVVFFHANEDYGKHVKVEGMGSFNHLFDPIFPIERNYVSPRWSLRQEYVFGWESFRSDYINPLLHDKGALLWQVSHNQPLARVLLDDSVNNGGFMGISTVHFNQNFLFYHPHLYQYRHQLAFIALQDFHGSESWWWANELVHYRNLYLAKEPTYEAMLQALSEQKVVTVRHDEITGYKTRMLGGAPGVQEHITAREDEWKWWDEKTHELNHPWAALTVVTPADEFEISRPENGVNIRVRCWWEGPREVLDEPVVELVQLSINGVEVQPEYMEVANRQGRVADAYYLYSWPEIETGEYLIEATVRNTRNGTLRVVSSRLLYES